MKKFLQKLYLIDETDIDQKHDEMISCDTKLLDHLKIINESLDFMDWLFRLNEPCDQCHLTLLRLGIRCFNSSGAALRLVRCGYWQPAITVMRDVYETQFLLDLLNFDRGKLMEWLSLGEPDRSKKFNAINVRKALDSRDGFNEQKRAKRYKILSSYGAHASPEGFAIISPNWLTQIGPFPDKKLLTATIEELALVTGHVAATVSPLVSPAKAIDFQRKESFLQLLKQWQDKYISRQDSVDT